MTRIFLLIKRDPSLVREIVTPILPKFFTTCLSLAKKALSRHFRNDQQLLFVILQAFLQLISHYPTSFRPFVGQTRALILRLAVPSSFGSAPAVKPQRAQPTAEVCQCARRLFVTLNVCAPKSSGAEERKQTLNDIITSIQRILDLVLRSIHENSHNTSLNSAADKIHDFEEVIHDDLPEPLHLPPWTGIESGLERVDGLLKTLKAYICSPFESSGGFPVGQIFGLSQRILSVSDHAWDRNTKVKVEINKDEREYLFLNLPNLHARALQLLLALHSRLGHNATSICSPTLGLALSTLERNASSPRIRQASFKLILQTLRRAGHITRESFEQDVSRCIDTCCKELLPDPSATKQSSHELYLGQGSVSASRTQGVSRDSEWIASETEDQCVGHGDLHASAAELLCLFVAQIQDGDLPISLRERIDRTAILSQHKDLMRTSAMVTAQGKLGEASFASILPFLARMFPGSPEVESLLRPQMPPIVGQPQDLSDIQSVQITGKHIQNGTELSTSARELDSYTTMDASENLGSTQDGTGQMTQNDANKTDDVSHVHSDKRQKIVHHIEIPNDVNGTTLTLEPTNTAEPEQVHSGRKSNPFQEVYEMQEGQISVHEAAAVKSAAAAIPRTWTEAPPSVKKPYANANSMVNDSDESESDFQMPILELDSLSSEEEESIDEAQVEG